MRGGAPLGTQRAELSVGAVFEVPAVDAGEGVVLPPQGGLVSVSTVRRNLHTGLATEKGAIWHPQGLHQAWPVFARSVR